MKFIESALSESDEHRVLIHCSAGVNRSPSMTIGFVMLHCKLTLKAAYELVSSKHTRTCIHDSYMSQLRELDKDLYGEYSTSEDELPTTRSTLRAIFAKLEMGDGSKDDEDGDGAKAEAEAEADADAAREVTTECAADD